jgi:hypothetical protein
MLVNGGVFSLCHNQFEAALTQIGNDAALRTCR